MPVKNYQCSFGGKILMSCLLHLCRNHHFQGSLMTTNCVVVFCHLWARHSRNSRCSIYGVMTHFLQEILNINGSEPALQLNKEIFIKLHQELINCYFIMKIISQTIRLTVFDRYTFKIFAIRHTFTKGSSR